VQKNDFVKAEQDLLKASGFKGTKITQGEIYLELGNLYFKKEQSEKAIETLKKGLQIAKKPDVAQQLRYEISRMLHQLGRTSEAISFMEDNLKNLASSEGEVALLSKFSMAEFQFAQKDYSSALSYYDNVIQSNNRDLKLDALYKKAWCYRFLKNLDAALKTFDELHVQDLKGKPKYGQEVPYLIAQIHQEAGSDAKAREWFTKVVVNDADYAPESTLALAEIDFEQGEFENVIKHAKGFLVSYKNHKLEPNIRFLIAESAYEQGDVKLAKDNYRRIIENKDANNREDALYGSAWLLFENGEHDQALKDINKLLTDFKETTYQKSAIQLKSNILRQLDRLEEAREVLSFGMKSIGTEDGESILLDLAKIESDLNHPEKALEIYNKLLKDYPDTELRGMVTYEKGWLYMGMDKPNEAFLMFKAYEQSHPDGEFIHDVQYVMGELAYAKEKYLEALSYYEKSRASDRYKDGSLYKMAWSHFELENHKASAEAFSTLVKECPESSLLMESLYREGQSWLNALEFDRALKSLEHFVERGKSDPFYGDALSDLGRVYEKKDLGEKAYDVYETYLKLFPEGEQAVPVSFRMGKLSMQAEKYSEAREYFQKVLENVSHTLAPESQFLEGECFFSEGRYAEAIGAFLKTEKFAFGENWQAAALFKIAKSHKMLKNTPRAKEYLEKLMSRFPKSDYTGKAMQELRKLN
jgi:tetratricopeptide (TPR) repeat protein